MKILLTLFAKMSWRQKGLLSPRWLPRWLPSFVKSTNSCETSRKQIKEQTLVNAPLRVQRVGFEFKI